MLDPVDFQPEVEALVPRWADDLAPIALTRIETAEQYVKMATYWKAVSARRDEIKAFFAERKHEVQVVLDRVRQDEKDSLGHYPESAQRAGRLLGDYDHRKREEAELERRRQEAEAQAKAEAEQLAAALQADRDGALEMARELLEEPVTQTLVRTVTPDVPQVDGVTMPGRWKAEVVNLERLIVAAALEIQKKTARIGVSMLAVNHKGVNSQATAMKGNLQRLAEKYGLRVWEDRTPRRQ